MWIEQEPDKKMDERLISRQSADLDAPHAACDENDDTVPVGGPVAASQNRLLSSIIDKYPY